MSDTGTDDPVEDLVTYALSLVGTVAWTDDDDRNLIRNELQPYLRNLRAQWTRDTINLLERLQP